MNAWGIDPGETHVGVAVMHNGHVVKAKEVTPEVLIEHLEKRFPVIDVVVVEEFRLYPWKLQQQGFKEMKTAELIGVIKYLCNRGGIELVQQGANIKKVAEGMARAKGVTLIGKGRHAKDAELHALYWYWRQNAWGD